MNKSCFKCGRSLPVSEFYRHRAMGDGYLGKCRDCTRRDVATNRMKKIDTVRAYDRARHVGARAARSMAASARWIKSNPEKVLAEARVNNAIRDGRLQRAPCEFCGEARTVAHHDDYTKPLDVRWLCDPCHKSHHARLRGKTPWRLIQLGVS